MKENRKNLDHYPRSEWLISMFASMLLVNLSFCGEEPPQINANLLRVITLIMDWRFPSWLATHSHSQSCHIQMLDQETSTSVLDAWDTLLLSLFSAQGIASHCYSSVLVVNNVTASLRVPLLYCCATLLLLKSVLKYKKI